MPVRNGGKYLNICLDSILQQSYANWQLVVIDDHSTDQTYQVLQAYAQADRRIQVYKNIGIGIIPALQVASTHATGAYITRMDADDIMPVKKLDILLKLLAEKSAGYVATGHVSYFSDEHQIGDGYRSYEQWLNQLCTSDTHFSEIYRECVIPSPCWMMRRSDFEQIGGFFANRYPEDYDLCFRMYAHGLTVVSSADVLHHWRDHNSRASRNDPNYADNRFLDLKMYYFIKIEVAKYDKIILVGAGKKGKAVARHLQSQMIDFDWMTNNERKVGVDIYGVVLQSCTQLATRKHPSTCVIAAIGNKLEQLEVSSLTSDAAGLMVYFFG